MGLTESVARGIPIVRFSSEYFKIEASIGNPLPASSAAILKGMRDVSFKILVVRSLEDEKKGQKCP